VETVPPVADQVTAVFVVPVTVAVNCWVAPVARLAVDGPTLTVIAGVGAEAPQPNKAKTHANAIVRDLQSHFLCMCDVT
jgi:hypothetical protein